MSLAGPERETQQRIIALLTTELGYRYLGNWTDRPDNSNIEPELLAAYLRRAGYTEDAIGRALHLLRTEADNPARSLYDNNHAVYNLLRYGVPVKLEAGANTEPVHLIDWEHPERNDLAVAEEVTLRGLRERRPDLVLYLNGIAVGVIELKNGRTDVRAAIRQLLSNQQPEYNAWFFSTVQVVFAGNDAEGLRYAAINTPEKYFLNWKEDEAENARLKVDKYLLKLCARERLLELMHDFVVFDGGVKKLPRPHQYFGVKEAQRFVREYRGGIIWHTQGSGKSIVMVLLARWILENRPNARVLIVTDRDELDKQIERVFTAGGTEIHRTGSGADLMAQLAQAKPRLLCSLVHKFGQRGVKDFEAFIAELGTRPSPAVGELFVFVDECHRTQAGKLHRTMKALLPGAVFIGFTGTPLLKADRATSSETFGAYIHTYKFNEAVADRVVLDLVYEARDVEQSLGSPERIDAWFDAKTRGLNSWQKAALREKWGTMQNVLSSRSRMERVVEDIVLDFASRPRLDQGTGNAMLVASSIYEACRYYELFGKTELKGHCGLVTSYNPAAQNLTLEETGANTETDRQAVYNTYTELLRGVTPAPGKSAAETYEDNARDLFVTQPATMKLLIVVDKLLTGFDAPGCTYLYIDKSMQDHGLFQAICRTNRLDGESKLFGFIVDYKDLFRKLVNERGTGALQVYTSELDTSAGGSSPDVLMQDRLAKGRARLDEALEAAAHLCEPVPPPRDDLQFIRYFCGNTELPGHLAEREPLRAALYKAIAAVVRAYANIADDLAAAGYTAAQAADIRRQVAEYAKVREMIRGASGETIDLKAYEADMRYLIDTYIEAKHPQAISGFGETGLLELIRRSGVDAAVAGMPESIRSNPDAVAEVMANNVSSRISREHLNDPAYFDRMSALLKEILEDLRARRIDYQDFLRRMADLAGDVLRGHAGDAPAALDTPGRRAIYNHILRELESGEAGAGEASAGEAGTGRMVSEPPSPYAAGAAEDEESDADSGAASNAASGAAVELALRIDGAVKKGRPDSWRGSIAKERVVKSIVYEILKDAAGVERLFPIIFAQGEY
ncbi:MAG: HsdR family type I site-specific deoxyribonuclease [Bacteroidetes bacterium]|nr:HsdR family type I site-specific deoxyribonuclease [Bacteroidota bacterium]